MGAVSIAAKILRKAANKALTPAQKAQRAAEQRRFIAGLNRVMDVAHTPKQGRIDKPIDIFAVNGGELTLPALFSVPGSSVRLKLFAQGLRVVHEDGSLHAEATRAIRREFGHAERTSEVLHAIGERLKALCPAGP